MEDAITLAAKLHRGQVDKGGAPYVLHPLRVMAAMETQEERIAAVLHDVVEDTPTSLDQLKAWGCPDTVLEAVDALSRRPGEDWDSYLERVAANGLARRVKVKDLEDNLRPERLLRVGPKDRARLYRYQRAWERLRERR